MKSEPVLSVKKTEWANFPFQVDTEGPQRGYQRVNEQTNSKDKTNSQKRDC